MVSARRNERRLRTKALLQFKTQHAAIKLQRPFQVSDFQVDMADADTRINGVCRLFHADTLAPDRPAAKRGKCMIEF